MASPPKCYRDMTTSELVDWALSGSGRYLGNLEYALTQRLKDESRKAHAGKPHVRKARITSPVLWECRGPGGVAVYGPTPTIAYGRWKEVMGRDVYRSIKARSS